VISDQNPQIRILSRVGEHMRNKKQRLLSEAKKDLELAVIKSLCQAPLRPSELNELESVNETDLMRDHGCDLYMAEKVVCHAKSEQYRIRSQNLYTPNDETAGYYPESPYTRTSPINESPASSLKKIMTDAKRARRHILGIDNLPSWCEHKIKQSQAMIRSVERYLERLENDPTV